MNISPINYNISYPSYKGRSRDLEKVLDTVSSKGFVSPDDKILIIEKIKYALSNILKPSRFMEEGSHKAVYRITSKYAARVPVDEKLTVENIGDEFVWGENRFQNLKNYYGEPVMRYGEFQILRNIGNQIPAGIPEHLAKKFNKNMIKKYYAKRYLPRFAQLSQDSYNELAKNLSALNQMKFGFRNYGVFDFLNPNNIITSNGKLFIVDEIDTLYDKSYANSTAKLLNVFINNASKDYEAPLQTGKEIKYVRKIFRKVIISGVYADLLHADSKEDIKYWETALKKCKIETPLGEILSVLDKISVSNSTYEEKRNMTNSFLTVLFGKNPSNK